MWSITSKHGAETEEINPMKISLLRFLLLLLGAAGVAAGCATSRDSDLPWNTPATWEGSPSIPGFSE
jgi:hypothetical protein